MGAGHNNRAKRTCNTYIRTGVRMPTCQALIYLEDGMVRGPLCSLVVIAVAGGGIEMHCGRDIVDSSLDTADA